MFIHFTDYTTCSESLTNELISVVFDDMIMLEDIEVNFT